MPKNAARPTGSRSPSPCVSVLALGPGGVLFWDQDPECGSRSFLKVSPVFSDGKESMEAVPCFVAPGPVEAARGDLGRRDFQSMGSWG